MQFQITTDYALRIVSYLYINKDQLSTAKEMAEQLGITYKYFMKIINKLKQAGIVQSIQGCNGGYMLDPKGSDLTVYDVICIMEGEININRCLEPDRFCSRDAVTCCRFHGMFADIQSGLIDSLKEKRIADFI